MRWNWGKTEYDAVVGSGSDRAAKWCRSWQRGLSLADGIICRIPRHDVGLLISLRCFGLESIAGRSEQGCGQIRSCTSYEEGIKARLDETKEPADFS